MRYLFIVIIVFFSILSTNAGEVITLESAINLAKENNIELKRAVLQLNGVRKDRDTAYNVFFPKISGYTTISRSNIDPGEPFSNINLSLGYEATFNFTPALFNAITLLKKNYELGEINYNQAVAYLEKDVKEIFYNILLLEEQNKLLENNLTTMKSRYNLTKLNYNAGLVSELELLKVQVSYENFKPELNNFKNMYNTTLISFKNMLGLNLDQNIVLSGEINPEIIILTVDEAFIMAINNNSDLKKIYKSSDFLEAQKKTKFSQNFLPVIALSYSSATNLNDPFGNNRLKVDNFSDDSGKFSFSLLYSFNALFPNSSERIELEKISRSISDIELQSESLINGLRLQITNYISTLNNSMNIQEGLKLTVLLAEKSLGKIEQSYSAGTSTLLEVENAQNEYKKARLELLKEKFNYNSNKLKLEAIISPL